MKKLLLLMLIVFSTLSAQETIAYRSTTVILQELRDTLRSQQDVLDQQDIVINAKITEIQSLQAVVADLGVDLEKAIEEDNRKAKIIAEQNTELKAKNKGLFILSFILGAFTIAHFVLLFLNLKFKIKIPYWLNTII